MYFTILYLTSLRFNLPYHTLPYFAVLYQILRSSIYLYTHRLFSNMHKSSHVALTFFSDPIYYQANIFFFLSKLGIWGGTLTYG